MSWDCPHEQCSRIPAAPVGCGPKTEDQPAASSRRVILNLVVVVAEFATVGT